MINEYLQKFLLVPTKFGLHDVHSMPGYCNLGHKLALIIFLWCLIREHFGLCDKDCVWPGLPVVPFLILCLKNIKMSFLSMANCVSQEGRLVHWFVSSGPTLYRVHMSSYRFILLSAYM